MSCTRGFKLNISLNVKEIATMNRLTFITPLLQCFWCPAWLALLTSRCTSFSMSLNHTAHHKEINYYNLENLLFQGEPPQLYAEPPWLQVRVFDETVLRNVLFSWNKRGHFACFATSWNGPFRQDVFRKMAPEVLQHYSDNATLWFCVMAWRSYIV